jgi:hypothetical protein
MYRIAARKEDVDLRQSAPPGVPTYRQHVRAFRDDTRRGSCRFGLQKSCRQPKGVDHSFAGGATHMARLTLGKSRVRESRMLGSVKAEPNGMAARPPTLSVWLLPSTGTGLRDESRAIPIILVGANEERCDATASHRLRHSCH